MAEPKPKRTPRKPPVTVNLIDVLPVADELKLLRLSVDRLCAIMELYCVSQGIAMRVEEARPKDLADTSTDYGGDPEFAEFIDRMQREAGRELTESEAAKVFETWKKLDTETA
jgi:hypothetical protein